MHCREIDCRGMWNYSLSNIYIYITNRCNLRCRHCYVEPTYSNAMGALENEVSIADLKRFVTDAIPLGLRHVKISGGEPLLRVDDVLEICRHCRDNDISFTMETNAALVTEEIADALAEVGFYMIATSLDGATAETHDAMRGVKGAYEKTISGIRMLASRGVNVQIITAATQTSKREFPDIVRIGGELGASSFKFTLITAVGRGLYIPEDERLSVLEYIEFCKTFDDWEDVRILSSLPVSFKRGARLFNEIGTSCAILNLFSVLGNGDISICGMGEHSDELILGNVRTSNLISLWRNHPLLKQLRTLVPRKLEGVCSSCIHKSVCLGYCRAITFLEKGSFTAPWEDCQRAFDSGIFPKTRLIDNNI